VVGFNFLTAEVDQGFLLPPDMREWLDPDHLVFTVMDAVAQFDLSGFHAGYRGDGRGGAAYDPQLMVGLLLFAYCEGVKSSRQIERRCARDVAYRIVSGNRRPDHATIARFRDRHQTALREVFVQVLRLCAEAGLVRVGLVALDGTKLEADASGRHNYDLDRVDKAIARVSEQMEQLLAESVAQDAAEDAAEADRADPPMPPSLRERQQRLVKLQAAKQRLEADAEARQAAQQQRQTAWEQARAAGVRVGRPPGATVPKRGRDNPPKTNLTDPDSKIMKTKGGFRQSYNAQAVVTSSQIIIGAEIVGENTDVASFHRMLDAARDALDAAGVKARIRAVAADAGYSSATNREHARPDGDDPIQLTDVPPPSIKRRTRTATDDAAEPSPLTGDHQAPARPDQAGPAASAEPGTTPAATRTRFDPEDPRFTNDPLLKRMAQRLDNPAGRRLYARRKIIVEPIFGQIKTLHGPRVQHRGRDAVSTEWKMITAAHNLLKYWRYTTAPAT
jgi:transposase